MTWFLRLQRSRNYLIQFHPWNRTFEIEKIGTKNWTKSTAKLFSHTSVLLAKLWVRLMIGQWSGCIWTHWFVIYLPNRFKMIKSESNREFSLTICSKNLKYLDGTVLIEHLDPVILFKGEDDTQRDDLHSLKIIIYIDTQFFLIFELKRFIRFYIFK